MERRLRPGASLRDGQALVSGDGRALLTMQGDGNLVLYEYFASGRRAHLWDSATAGSPGAVAHLQDDGELVVRRADGHVLWDSGTAGSAGAELVLRDDGDLVLERPDGRTAWASGTRLGYARVDFRPERDGFAFPDAFAGVVATLPGVGDVAVCGLCGGMAFAALDHWYAGVPVPAADPSAPVPDDVPPDGHPLTEHLRARTDDSFRVPSAARFAEWSAHPDHATWLYEGVDRWCTEGELPRLVAELRAGRPVPLGLVRARSLAEAGENHQVVAYGFEHDRATGRTTVLVHDSAAPGVEVHLTSERDEVGWTSSVGGRWRGFFVQDYTPRTPPPGPVRAAASGGAGVRGATGPDRREVARAAGR
ncbi:hypothetical protein [Cellulomonas cellasea]|uniref:Bulb-type lectin domain-containing protein n=2 Tax=Cellulomonas cellasea TaxID=43670 RepID=A0A0A0B6Q0_9CELL|nr:hypothetical protein [Cellulomonas cellasea]KGM01872.1 hypothetical protein Q760_16990 [Cellulomonas cellasea DSM 20118]GEA86507.1 hypothetical protein CCE01nite_04560 [Cellulomonas cellasea]